MRCAGCGLRVAGDGADALALMQTTLAVNLPGSSALDALENALMDHVAFERRLSPPLFMLLVNHFDWRDMQGRLAQGDPERHAALLDWIGAEDGMADLTRRYGLWNRERLQFRRRNLQPTTPVFLLSLTPTAGAP